MHKFETLEFGDTFNRALGYDWELGPTSTSSKEQGIDEGEC